MGIADTQELRLYEKRLWALKEEREQIFREIEEKWGISKRDFLAAIRVRAVLAAIAGDDVGALDSASRALNSVAAEPPATPEPASDPRRARAEGMAQLAAMGMTHGQIGARYQVSSGRVSQILKEFGLRA